MKPVLALPALAASLVLSPEAGAQEAPTLATTAESLCNAVEMNYGSDQAWLVLRRLAAVHLGLDGDDEQFASNFQTLWAEHGDQFICTGASTLKPHIRTPQALLKRIVDMNMEGQLFNGFLLASDSHPIDVNVVQWVDGEPETLLDYLNLIIEDESRHGHYSMNEIIRLRFHLINNFGAMTAEELGY